MKIKKTIEYIKENLKNPKKKALTQLALWSIFLIIIAVLLTNAPKNNNISNINLDNDQNQTKKIIDTYNFNLKIYDNENIMLITGSVTPFNTTVIYNGVEYNLKDNEWYQDENVIQNPLGIDITKFYYNKIIEILNDNSLVSTTEYKDKTIMETYSLNANDYYNYYDQSIPDSISKIEITKTKKGDIINNINIDLSAIYGYKYIMSIDYYNQNTYQMIDD